MVWPRRLKQEAKSKRQEVRSKVSEVIKPEVIKIDQSNPDPIVVAEIAEILKAGAVIAYPTDTYYGLGADMYNEAAVKRAFDIKGRMHDKPILILIAKKRDLPTLVATKDMSSSVQRVMDTFWPGPLTIVFYASKSVSDHLTASTGKIGIRLPEHTFCIKLINKLGRPITATSANISGAQSLNNPSDVLNAIGDRIDVLVDGGMTKGGCESTVLDVTGDEPVILREGATPASILAALLSGR